MTGLRAVLRKSGLGGVGQWLRKAHSRRMQAIHPTTKACDSVDWPDGHPHPVAINRRATSPRKPNTMRTTAPPPLLMNSKHASADEPPYVDSDWQKENRKERQASRPESPDEGRKTAGQHQQKNVATGRLHLRPGKGSRSGTSKPPVPLSATQWHHFRLSGNSSPRRHLSGLDKNSTPRRRNSHLDSTGGAETAKPESLRRGSANPKESHPKGQEDMLGQLPKS